LDHTRKTLEDAAHDRRACAVARPGAPWLAGVVCRLEPAGLVCDLPGHGVRVGEEVRLRLETDQRPVHLEATVLRVGVQVPERGPDGVMLGFLSSLPITEGADRSGMLADVVLPGGSVVSLVDPPLHVVQLDPRRAAFEAPLAHTLVFPEGSVLRLRLGTEADGCHEVRARVVGVVVGEGHLLYTIEFEDVTHQERHHRVVSALRTALAI